MDGENEETSRTVATAGGRRIVLSRLIGEDDRGTLHVVDGDEVLVAVLLMTAPDDLLPERVAAMRQLDPARWDGADDDHAYVAWPVEAVFDDDGTCVGYGMSRFTRSPVAPLAAVLDPDVEVPGFGSLGWDTLITIAANLSLMVHWLHSTGVVVGDLQEQTIWVTPEGRTTIVSCESFGFVDPATGAWAPPLVTRAETSAPELFRVIDGRSVADVRSDRFALAILVGELLSGGDHPFRGSPTTLSPERIATWTPGDNIEHGFGLYIDPRFIEASDPTLPSELVPADIDQLLRYTFGPGREDPDVRPDGETWFHALGNALDELVACGVDRSHWNPPGLADCVWCARTPAESLDAGPAMVSTDLSALLEHDEFGDPSAPAEVGDGSASNEALLAADAVPVIEVAEADVVVAPPTQRPVVVPEDALLDYRPATRRSPKVPILVGGGVALVLAAVIGVVVLLGGGDDPEPEIPDVAFVDEPETSTSGQPSTSGPGVTSLPTDPSTPSTPTTVAPAPVSPYQLVDDGPTRIYDSRTNESRLEGPGVVTVPVAGVGGVPAKGARAVVLNVVSTGVVGDGAVRVYASGGSAGGVSSRVADGLTTADLVISEIGSDGSVAVRYDGAGGTEIVIDVVGWVAEDSPLVLTGGQRIHDSAASGEGVARNEAVFLDILGQAGVPESGVDAVLLTIVSVAPSSDGALRVYPSDRVVPTGVSTRAVQGRTAADLVMSRIAPDGSVSILNSTEAVGLIVEVVGYIESGSALHLVDIEPVFDSSDSGSLLGDAESLDVPVLGIADVPTEGVESVLLSVTTANVFGEGAIQAVPGGNGPPTGISGRVSVGSPTTELILVDVGSNGSVRFFHSGVGSELRVDIVGWVAAES